MPTNHSFPLEVCGCPTNKGSLKAAIIGGLVVVMIPMVIELLLTYSFSVDGLKATPDAIYVQLGKVFMYSEYDPLILLFTLIIAGFIIGAFSGGIFKSIFSVLIFYVTALTGFFLLGLMYLGEDTKWNQFNNIATIEFLIAFGSLCGSAIVMAIILTYRSNGDTLPFKMKPMKRKERIEEPSYPKVQYVQYVPVQGMPNQLPSDIDFKDISNRNRNYDL